MKIGIIGIGVVGGAVHKSFQNKNISDLVIYDKYKKLGSIDLMFDSDIIFLCLPTPYSSDLKCYDKSAIHDVCQELEKNNYSGLVVLKSTVEPQTTQILSNLYKLSICHNPEFLTASTAYEDFENQKHIVIGKTKNMNPEHYEKLKSFFEKNYPDADISVCSSNESELMKIGVNNFYSIKIQFFNELYFLAQKQNDTDFNTVKDLMLKNGWIHPMHTLVPGTDGKLSYGGMCFPKDTNALLQHMIKENTPHSVLEGTVNERNLLRDD